MKIIELPILLRVEVALKDNKSGQTHVESYPEIDSGLLRADQYFWFTPSHHHRGGTRTIPSPSLLGESHSSQELIARS